MIAVKAYWESTVLGEVEDAYNQCLKYVNTSVQKRIS